MTRIGRSIVWVVAASAALYLVLVLFYSNGSQVLRQLEAFPAGVLLAGLALATLNYAFRFLKWQLYLRLLEIHVPTGASALIFVSGFALTVTPGKVGEVLKSYLLRESYNVPIARSAPIVLAERLTDLVSLLLLSLLGASVWMSRDQRYLIIIGFSLCAVLLIGLAWRGLTHRLFDLLSLLPPRRLMGVLIPRLRTFYDAASVLLQPLPLFICVVLSTLAWFFECLACYVVVRGAGAIASALLCTFIYSVTTVAGALSFVPGGLGVTEGGMAVLLGQLAGVSKPAAVAATLIVRVLTLWFAVLLGVVALAIYGRRRKLDLTLDALKKSS